MNTYISALCHQSHIDFKDREVLSEITHAPEDSGTRKVFPNNSVFAVIPEENDNSNAEDAKINISDLEMMIDVGVRSEEYNKFFNG